MIRRISGALTLCGLLLFMDPAAAQEAGTVADVGPRVAGGEFNVMLTRLSGRFEREQFGGIGQTIYYGRTLEYDKYDVGYEAKAWVWVSRLWRFEGRWFGTSHVDQHGDVRRPFLHDSTVFLPGERVRSEVEINIASGGARATFGGDTVRLSVPFGIIYTNHYLQVRSRDVDDRASQRIQAWSPYVGFGVHAGVNEVVGFSGEVRCFAYRTGSIKRYGYFEAEANVTFSFLDGRLRAHTGPRVIAQDYHAEFSKNNDRTSDFTITAWQFGATLDF
jgi:hypothetical protein